MLLPVPGVEGDVPITPDTLSILLSGRYGDDGPDFARLAIDRRLQALGDRCIPQAACLTLPPTAFGVGRTPGEGFSRWVSQPRARCRQLSPLDVTPGAGDNAETWAEPVSP